MTIDPNETLGGLATQHPGAPAVFLRHRLDFCCRGRQKLAEACENAGLDPATVIAEIAERNETSGYDLQRVYARSTSEIIDFIVTRYHEPLRNDLPGLIAAAHKIERVHASKPGCPRGLAAQLEQFDDEVRNHLAKEEQVLFRALSSGAHGPQVHMPIRMMMHEHEDHGTHLQRIREITADFQLPAEACATWRTLYAELEKLEADLMAHIHLENNVLFPRALGD